MSFYPTQADQAWQTLACPFQNTTYSVDVSQNWVSTIHANVVSSTPLSTIGHSEFPYHVQSAQYLNPTTALFETIVGSIYADTVSHSITGMLIRVVDVSFSNFANMTTTPGNFTENLIWSVTSNFTAAIPELLTNVTLNIMAMNRPTCNTTCNSTRTEIVYQYRSQYLLLTYGLGLLATLCCFAAGVYALRDSGVAMDTFFSEIVAATQNPTLKQALANEGYSTAAKESAAYLEQRIMYGELVEEDGNEDRSGLSKGERRAAFGLQGQIAKMEKAL